MGYTTKGSIVSFWPDDTENCFYEAYGTSLGEIMRKAKEKWPDVEVEHLQISAENIHTDCLTYDLHDGGDWTQFVVVTKEY